MTEKDVTQMSYEEAFAALQEVVEKLESGALSLDETLNWYARGKALADRCQALLEAAELRLEELNGDA